MISKIINGERIAVTCVDKIGSWKFILYQSFFLFLWILINSTWLIHGEPDWDPYPYILLNLLLSFQAAFTAPLILMAQNVYERKLKREREDLSNQINDINDILNDILTNVKYLNNISNKIN